MSYRIAFNTNGGAAMADATAEANDWADVPAAEPGEFLSGRTFDGWIVTGHDRKTAVYSSDGGVTETALDSDPAVVVHDGAIAVKNLAADGGLVQLSARWRVQFGGLNDGCPAVWVAPFTPICAKGGVDGSTPLTLDVPAPVFAPYIPPPECACFLFDSSKTANVNVTMSPGNTMKATGTAKIEISSVGDCCDGKYEVTPTITIDIPECVTEDKEYENTVPIGPSGNGAITYRWGIRNCVPFFEMSAEPLEFPDIVVPGFCLDEPTFTLKGTYKFPNDTKATQVLTKEITLKFGNSADNPGCHTYTPGNIDLDLTDLAFGNNGDVYKDDNTGNLIVGGILDSNDGVKWWYGGGAGDRKDDTHVGKRVYQRGPTMRGVATVLANDLPMVYDGPEYKLMDKNSATNTRWRSDNKDGTDPYGKPETEGEEWATGNLDMVLPSGFQWDSKPITRGVSVVMSEFAWNPGGLLCSEEEKKWALVLAPGIAVWKDNAKINYNNGSTPVSIDVGGMNASGIAVMKSPQDARQQPGLIIYDGNGLRVFGADGKTADTEITAADTQATATKPIHIGQLEVFGHDGDFKFNYDGKMVMNDKKSAAPWTETSDDEVNVRPYSPDPPPDAGEDDPPPPYTMDTFSRDHDCTLPVVTIAGLTYWDYNENDILVYQTQPVLDYLQTSVDSENDFSREYNKISVPSAFTNTTVNGVNASLKDLADAIVQTKATLGYITSIINPLQQALDVVTRSLGCLVEVEAHFSRSGVLMGVDNSPDCQGITRRYQPTEPATP